MKGFLIGIAYFSWLATGALLIAGAGLYLMGLYYNPQFLFDAAPKALGGITLIFVFIFVIVGVVIFCIEDARHDLRLWFHARALQISSLRDEP